MARLAESLRVLLVEDSADDAALLEREIRRGGFAASITRVETEAQFLASVSLPWDVVIADYVLPRFSALGVLRHLRHLQIHVPTIVVSGTVGEENLLQAMRAGAHDYLQKQNLSRLVPAIRREVGDSALRRRHREAEAALREAQERFRFVVENTGDAVYRVRFPSLAYDYMSPGIEKLTGYRLAEITELGFARLVVKGGGPAASPVSRDQKAWARELQERGESWTDYLIKSKSGEERWLADHSFPWRDGQGRLLGAVGTLVDVTERARAEEALRRSEEYFRSLIENASDLILVLDRTGRIVYESPAVERILGYRPEERVGRSALELLPDEDGPHLVETIRRLLAQPGLTESIGTRARHRDGSWRDVEAIATSRTDESGAPTIVLNVRDVTDRKSLEAQLTQAQKMEAVGRLAGGVAHDFNNLTTAILGYSELMLRRLDPQDPMRRHVAEITRAAERAAALTRQLLAFSRKQLLQPRVLDLAEVLERSRGLLGRLIGEDIELLTRTAPDVGRVRADPVQLDQVLLNLAVNARDAMPRGGRLVLEASNADLDDEYAREHVTVRPGPYVMLAVSDTGHGMDKQTQERIFEPFFTTKEQGKGTGLGLSTVYGIVKQSGGYVWVYSEVGRGTTFKVYLPRVQDAAERESPPRTAEPAAERAAASETLLLVEDDASVRELLRELLESAGFRVLEASRPGEAVEIVKSRREPIDLLVTDVVMPEMTGPELARRLEDLRPGLRLLFLSGYTEGVVLDKGLVSDGAHFLQKPFTTDALEAKVREVLDAPARTAR
ncbi:MAG: hybrid sensor histidine kinase/response regulator [Acidobacteria bacterium]|nr:MAG: hybrid sensor histidine kinase/response regulator [Acidobacteriota bacterium]